MSTGPVSKGPPDLKMPERVLLGPGPSNVHPRVYQAMTQPVVGYLDPSLFKVLDEVKELLRWVFQTQNTVTFPISGTGSAGMEAVMCNLVEPGDRVVVGVNGLFGARLADLAARCGAEVVPVEADWGRAIDADAIRKALSGSTKTKAVAVVHAETSTGILQPLEEISSLAHEHEALFLVDAVTSLGGCSLTLDATGVDACYSCTQKCLSCPPALSPVSFSEAAVQSIGARQKPVQSFYFDLKLLDNYWGEARAYHHTIPMTMIYALYEGLRIIHEEGLEHRVLRHERNAAALRAGLEALGLKLFAEKDHRLATLTSISVPDGVDDSKIRGALLNTDGIEIGGGLGALRGKVWRIGLMGYASTMENVQLVISRLGHHLGQSGFKCDVASAEAAARSMYDS